MHRYYPESTSSVHRDYGLRIYRCGLGGRSGPATDYPVRYFEFYALSQLLDGRGIYRQSDGRIHFFDPGEAVMVSPGTHHFYGGYESVYQEDTICFHGPIADYLKQAGVINDGIIQIGSSRRLKPIIEVALDPAPDRQIQANSMLQKLLVDIYLENRRQQWPSFIEPLLNTIQNDPGKWWTVEMMAEYCQLSSVHFRRRFKEEVGISPKRYIDTLKMQIAAERLRASSLPVAEIAESLGYLDAYHFSRRFKEMTGHSPRSDRQQTTS